MLIRFLDTFAAFLAGLLVIATAALLIGGPS
jgi:hypothetical protein